LPAKLRWPKSRERVAMTTFLPADCLSKNTVLKNGFIFHWIWLTACKIFPASRREWILTNVRPGSPLSTDFPHRFDEMERWKRKIRSPKGIS
ncbi:hypothetical protein, partial [Hydrogenimonas sp.]